MKVSPTVASDFPRLRTASSTACPWLLSTTSAQHSENSSYCRDSRLLSSSVALEVFSTGEMGTHPSYLPPKDHPGLAYPSNRTATNSNKIRVFVRAPHNIYNLPPNTKSTFDHRLRLSLTFPRCARKISHGRLWGFSPFAFSRGPWRVLGLHFERGCAAALLACSRWRYDMKTISDFLSVSRIWCVYFEDTI